MSRKLETIVFLVASISVALIGCSSEQKPVYVESTASGEGDRKANFNSLDRDLDEAGVSFEFFSLVDGEVLDGPLTYKVGETFRVGWRIVGDNPDSYGVGFVDGNDGKSGGTNRVSVEAGKLISDKLKGDRYKLYLVARNEKQCRDSKTQSASGEGRRGQDGSSQTNADVRCRIPHGAEITDGIHPDEFDVLAIVPIVPKT